MNASSFASSVFLMVIYLIAHCILLFTDLHSVVHYNKNILNYSFICFVLHLLLSATKV